MPITIYALDHQFAAATDSNVNNAPGQSTFDYPPNSTKDLVITSQAGDSTPFIFSPGDTYSITFGGNGGTTISDATVIRSDDINYGGDTGYAVVFEGLDSNGDLAQVVWTPEFDLETWYFDNFSGGNPPGFYTTDGSAVTYAAPCFTAETQILTEDGMRPAGSIKTGQGIVTRDHGVQTVLWVARSLVKGVGRAAPVRIEADVLGNFAAVEISQQHRVLLGGLPAMEAHGAPEVLAPAMSLINGATVRLAPRAQVEYVHLLFARHEVLCAQGMATESLLWGDQTRRMARAAGTVLPPRLRGLHHCPARPLITRREGEGLWREITRARTPKRAMLGRRGKARSPIYILPLTTGGPQPAYIRLTGTAPYAEAMRAAQMAALAAFDRPVE